VVPRRRFVRYTKTRRLRIAAMRLRLSKPFVAGIVTSSEPDALVVRGITGGTGAPVLLRYEDALAEEAHRARRSALPDFLPNPAVLLLSPDMHNMGGISRYDWAWTEAAIDLGHPVRVVSVWPSGSIAGKSVGIWRRASFLAKAILTSVVRRPKAIVATHPGLAPVAMLAARAAGARYAVTFHGSDAWVRFGKPQAIAIKRADLRIPVSYFTRDFVAESLGIPASDFYVTGSVVSSTIEEKSTSGPRKPSHQKDNGLTVLTVSRLDESVPHKGHAMVIEAVALLKNEFPSLRYVVIGDGEHRETLEKLVESKGISDRVDFKGRVSDEELADAYRTADVFVMPSVVSFDPPEGEGFGLVYLEAGAFSAPSIAARSGGATETVLDGITGLLVEPGSIQDLVSAMRRLLADEELRMRLGHNAYLRSQEFIYPAFKKRCHAVLEGLLTGADPKEIEPEYPRSSLALSTADTGGTRLESEVSPA
jgi:phosphatidylinositol alpha-1,6-mannosyltransferase